MKQALTIAGSDSGGGAGIQADLKTFHAHGVFGASVVTAITAQNTIGVHRAEAVAADMVRAQMAAVLDDLDIAAVKTGMLSSAEIVGTVSEELDERRVDNIVVDPVMISKSGHKLLEDDAVLTLKSRLLPLALVVTPNLHEAQLLAEMTIQSTDHMKEAARRIREFGCRNVLIKGGHAAFNPATDLLYDGMDFFVFEAKYMDTKNLHGTGCTFSAAIAARLALGEPLRDAVDKAKTYVTRAIAASLAIGRGHGPTNHFYFVSPDDFLGS